jgi:microcystin-dependent protein
MNGASLLRANYSDLFSMIGTTYGSVDSTHFNLPSWQNPTNSSGYVTSFWVIQAYPDSMIVYSTGTVSTLNLQSNATSGVMQVVGPAASSTRIKTIRDANDTILELGGSYTPTGTWTNMSLSTPTITGGVNFNSTAATTSTDGYLYRTTLASYVPVPTGTTYGLAFMGNFYAAKVYNAVYNDIADFIEVDEACIIEYGKLYCMNEDGTYSTTTQYCQEGIIGLASDTYGFGVGQKGGKEIPIAIGGFVLAHVDDSYRTGTALTSAPGGGLTAMKEQERRMHPERIVATYWKKEHLTEWNGVVVAGRNWVKIK